MKKHEVAKLVITDSNDTYLVMYRNNHPYFGNEIDLPGGTVEEGETPLEAMIREVQEEAGVAIDQAKAKHVITSADYSDHGAEYSLFSVQLAERPEVTISWEHAHYAWLSRDEFLAEAKQSMDRYMNMAHDALSAF